MEVAGSTCVAWSTMGMQEGFLHQASIMPWLAWARLMLESHPHVIIHECTPTYDEHGLNLMLGEVYHISSSIASPDDWGIPVRRTRKYTMCVRKDIRTWWTWCRLSQTTMFGRPVVLGSTVYLQVPEEWRKNDLLKRAKKAQVNLDGTFPVTDLDMLPPGERERAVRHIRAYSAAAHSGTPHSDRGQASSMEERSAGTSPAGPEDGSPGSVWVDLSQEPTRRGLHLSKSLLPALCRNTRLFEVTQQRSLAPLQHFVVQGFPVVEVWGGLCDSESPTSLPPQYFPYCRDIGKHVRRAGLSDSVVRAVTGNGMHLSHVGSAMLFVLLNIKGPPHAASWSAKLGNMSAETMLCASTSGGVCGGGETGGQPGRLTTPMEPACSLTDVPGPPSAPAGVRHETGSEHGVVEPSSGARLALRSRSRSRSTGRSKDICRTHTDSDN